ncbi:GTPase RhebL1 [Corapipo altera]|uniref:GTPase RhebL1 n=1 Tax=Corapipo altera TaxID=415028 RepID=UPI000FD64115|nr:GTPase RhebL1 [Corapipo altera]
MPRTGNEGALALGTPWAQGGGKGHPQSSARSPRGRGRSLRFHEWSPGGHRACAAGWPRPLRRGSANGSAGRGRVVVTCGRRCSGGGSAPSRRGGRFLLRRLSRPPAPRAVPPLRHRRVLVLGPPRAVGKTSLAHQFVEGKFVECYEPTVESTYNKVVVVGKDEFQLQLVDTAGQDEYSILPHSFIIGTHGYVLVYSVTSLRSFQVVKTLHDKLYESRGRLGRCCPSWGGGGQGGRALTLPMPAACPWCCWGTQQTWLCRGQGGSGGPMSPLPVLCCVSSREVRTDEGKKLAESWGAFFLESSAKESQVTQGILMKISEEIDRVDNSHGRSTGCCLTWCPQGGARPPG